ncbi:MAG: CapA family protein [Tissierellia bacterium]|nr:CapA family protein [Tissierellia bacterium]
MSRRSRRIRRRKKRNIVFLLVIIGIISAIVAVNGLAREKQKNTNENTDISQNENIQNTNEPNEPNEPEPIEDVTITLSATGDIMFHPSQIDGAYDKLSNSYDFRKSFKYVKNIFEDADIAIANFEGTTAGDEVYAYQGYPLFNAPDEVLDAIKEAGIDILSTANNHSLDTRKAGIIRTVEEINNRGMDNIGTYVSKPESRVLIKDVKGIKLGFISYTEMVNGLESVISPEDLDKMVNIIDEEKLIEDINYAKEQNVDVIVAYFHWGNEYARIQNERQEALADMLFKEGVDIILGSHPHVVQPSKTIDYEGEKKFIIYSMGNFISNQRIETLTPYGVTNPQYTEDGVIINIEIEKKGETGEVSIKNIEYIPLWVYKGTGENGNTEHVVYPIMDYIENEDLNYYKDRMNRSYNDTMSQMDVE